MIKPKVKSVRRNFKKTFSKKRNQRRAVYAGGSFAILSLLTGLAFTQAHAQNIEKTYQYKLEAKHEQVVEKEKVLETVTERLERVEAVKVDTEAQLKQKAEEEAKVKAELDKAKADLQAKADAEAEAARIAAAKPTPTRVAQATGSEASSRSYGGRGGGANTYDKGYCTWYVKNVRPDVGDNWGDANEWYANAQADGYATGSTPKAGAVGVSFKGTYGHVVYVNSVNSDGSINISEMNYEGWNVVSSRTTSSSSFVYIY